MTATGKLIGKMKHHKSIFIFSLEEDIYRVEYKPSETTDYKIEVFLGNENIWKSDRIPYGLKTKNPCKSQASEIVSIAIKSRT
jgi:hypothetical protein